MPLCARRRSFWQGLKTFATFGRGWLARGAACEALALTIAAGTAAPGVLAEQARDATRKTQGATVGAAATTAGAPVAAAQGASGWVLAAMLVVIAGAMAFLIYHTLAQRARAGALNATRIKSYQVVAYEDLGPEALAVITVVDFPATVVVDCRGDNQYVKGQAEYCQL